VNCSEVRENLSSYFDGELTDEMRMSVAAHLDDCLVCDEELAVFGKLSEMSAGLKNPPTPAHQWNSLEAKFDKKEEVPLRVSPPKREPQFPTRLMAMAATILVVIGCSFFAYQIWFAAEEHDHLAINFEQFLTEFDENPEKAQQILLAKYEGKTTTVGEATTELRYKPVIAKGMPAGCSLKNVYLLKMPCCTCPQALCEYDDGQQLAVFEHEEKQPVWFGNLPTISCICNGKPTNIVQIGDRLIATWKQGPRYITIIGARDLEEVTRFVAHLSDEKPRENEGNRGNG